MTTEQLIEILQSVAPETEIRVRTENGSRPIKQVWTLGYDGGAAIIVAED